MAIGDAAMPDHSESHPVVGHLCEWLAVAVGRLQQTEAQQKFVLVMLGHLEERLLAIPESTQGRNQALAYIYGLHVMYWEDKQDWQRVAEIGCRAAKTRFPNAVSRAHNYISLADALVKLGQLEEAAGAYLSGLRDQVSSLGHPEDIASFLLLLSHVVPAISDSALREIVDVVTSAQSIGLSQFADDRSAASAQLKSAAFALAPKLQESKLSEPRSM